MLYLCTVFIVGQVPIFRQSQTKFVQHVPIGARGVFWDVAHAFSRVPVEEGQGRPGDKLNRKRWEHQRENHGKSTTC